MYKLLLYFLIFTGATMILNAQSSPLLSAVKQSEFDKVRTLVDNGADLQDKDENGASVLMWAAYHNNLEILKFLVDRGADPTEKGVIWYTPEKAWFGNLLGIAAFNGNVPMLRYLIEECKIDYLDRGYDPKTGRDSGWTAYEFALINRKRLALKYLTAFGDPAIVIAGNYDEATDDNGQLLSMNLALELLPNSIVATDSMGNTALHIASRNGNLKLVDFLITSHARVDAFDSLGNTSLHLACKHGHIDIAKSLLRNKAELENVNGNGETPIFLAAQNNYLNLVRMLYYLGADPKTTNLDGQSSQSIGRDSIRAFLSEPDFNLFQMIDLALADEVMRILKNDPGKIHVVDQEGNTLLHKAAEYGYLKLAEASLDLGLDIDKQRDNGSTALMIAVFNNHISIAELLLQHGADPLIKRTDGFSAIHLAMQRCDLKIIARLLEFQPDINAGASNYNNTPLMTAAFYNRSRLVRLLINSGARVNQTNIQGLSAITASIYGYNSSIKELNSSVFDPMKWNEQFQLMQEDHLLTLRELIQGGAKLELKSADGQSAIDLEREFGSEKGLIFLDSLLQAKETGTRPQKGKQGKNDFDSAKVSLPVGHSTTINDAQFSPDGRYVLSGSSDKNLVLWDLRTGLELFRYTFKHAVTAVAFSPDGKQFVAAINSLSDNILLWDFTDAPPDVFKTFTGHPHFISALTFSPDGQRLFSAGWDQTIRVWAVDSGKLLTKYEGHEGPIMDFSLSADGKLLASAGSDKIIYLWNTQSGEVLAKLEGHTSDILSISIGPEGHHVASGDFLGNLILWDWRQNSPILQRKAPSNIGAVAFAPNGKYLAFQHSGIALLNIANQTIEKTLGSEEFSNIGTINFNSDGQLLLNAHSDVSGKLRVWDVSNGSLLRNLIGRTQVSMLASVSPHKVLIGTQFSRSIPPYYSIDLWDMRTGMRENEVWHSESNISALAISDDKSKLAVGMTIQKFDIETVTLSQQNVILVFDRQTMDTLWQFTGHQGIIRNLSFSPDGNLLASSAGEILQPLPDIQDLSQSGFAFPEAKYDSAIRIWDLNDGQLADTLTGHDYEVRSIRFSPDGHQIVSAGSDNVVRLWDVKGAKELKSVIGGPVAIFINEGHQVAAAGYGVPLFIWNLQDNEVTPVDLNTSQMVSSLAYSETTDHLMIGTISGQTFLWDYQSEKLIQTFDGQSDFVLSSIYLADQNRFLNSSMDGTIKLWDPSVVLPVITIVPMNQTDWITFTPDFFYTSSKDAARNTGFAIGKNTYPFEQFDLVFNRPDRVLEAIGHSDQDLMDKYRQVYYKRLKFLGQESSPVALTPDLPILEIVNEQDIPINTSNRILPLHYHALGKLTPIDAIFVSVNDNPIISVKKKKGQSREAKGVLSIKLSGGKNHLRIYARDIDGRKSLVKSFVINFEPANDRKPRLYILAIGVSKHRQSQYDLRFPAKDASDIIELFNLKKEAYSSIETLLLRDKEVSLKSVTATKEWLRSSDIDDGVIVFYAGHGLLNEQKQLFFSTYNVDFSQPGRKGFPYRQLEDLLADIPARQKLLLIDACHSGELDKTDLLLNFIPPPELGEVQFRGSVGVQIDSLPSNSVFNLMKSTFVDLRNNTGAIVIASTGGEQLAFEGSQWSNGVFTSLLIQGLKHNFADLNQDGRVMVSELQKYLAEKVQKVTNGRQKPIMRVENISNDWRVW